MAQPVSHSESVDLRAGAILTIPVVIDSKSQEIEYSFSILGGLDVELSCTLHDESNSSTVELVPKRRISNEHTDRMRVNLDVSRGSHAVVEFQLSNAYSWVRSKKLSYKITVLSEPDELARAQLSAATKESEVADAAVTRLHAAAELLGKAQVQASSELAKAEAAAEQAARLVVSLREAAIAVDAEASAATVALDAARAAAADAHEKLAVAAASPLLQVEAQEESKQ